MDAKWGAELGTNLDIKIGAKPNATLDAKMGANNDVTKDTKNYAILEAKLGKKYLKKDAKKDAKNRVQKWKHFFCKTGGKKGHKRRCFMKMYNSSMFSVETLFTTIQNFLYPIKYFLF